MMKHFESDLKRLNGFMVSLKESKPDMTQNEIDQRNEVIDRLRESYKLFKYEFDEQTAAFERGFSQGYGPGPSGAYNTKQSTSRQHNFTAINEVTNDEFRPDLGIEQSQQNMNTEELIIDTSSKNVN